LVERKLNHQPVLIALTSVCADVAQRERRLAPQCIAHGTGGKAPMRVNHTAPVLVVDDQLIMVNLTRRILRACLETGVEWPGRC